MNVSEDFLLTTLPYLFQSRFMECLPYFAQIELAQTNQQLLQIYETRCKKRRISDSVNIIVTKDGIYINDEFILFKNEKSIKHYIQGNHFPTQFLTISNPDNYEGVSIGMLAKELIENGLYMYFQNVKILAPTKNILLFLFQKNQQKNVKKWFARNLADSTHDLVEIEIGWERKSSANKDFTNENYVMYHTDIKNNTFCANLSTYLNHVYLNQRLNK